LLAFHRRGAIGSVLSPTLAKLSSMFKNATGRAFDLQQLSEIVAVSNDLLHLKWETRLHEMVLCVSATGCTGDRQKKFCRDLRSITDKEDVNLYTLVGDKIKSAIPAKPKKVSQNILPRSGRRSDVS